jgi:ATPase subunit of ABC transporter with duplicated ATPase domains
MAEGATVGYLAQEPQVDPAKSVRDNVMEGVAAQRAILDRYNELAANYSDETADEMTKLQDEIEAKDSTRSPLGADPRSGQDGSAPAGPRHYFPTED